MIHSLSLSAMVGATSRSAARGLLAVASGIAIAVLVAPTATAQDGSPTVFTASRLVLAPDAVLEGADAALAVRDGKVIAVGREITAALRQRADKVDWPDATIVPGFVLPHHHLSTAGDLVETIDAFTPHLRASDAFDPFDEQLTRMVHGGITAVGLAPVSRNPFAGRSAVVQPTIGGPASVLAEDAYLKLALVAEALIQDRYPTSRMGAADMIRTAFAAAADPLGPQDAAHATLRAVQAGSMPLAIHVRTNAEITTALDVCATLGIDPILLEATEIGDSLERLKGSGVRVVLPPLDLTSDRDSLELPAKLETAGVPFAFLCQDGDQIRRSMALAVRHGVSRASALAAVTRVPATLLGVADRIGTLRVGRQADFAVFSGDPTDLTARLLDVRVGGANPHAQTLAPEAAR